MNNGALFIMQIYISTAQLSTPRRVITRLPRGNVLYNSLMNEPNFIIMGLADGYAAISNMHGRFLSPTLVGFGTCIRDAMRANYGIESADVEFTRGIELAGFATCATCAGTTHVETDGVGGQYLQNEFDAIDWTLKATRTCPACRGLGCEIPGFWEAETGQSLTGPDR